jgi:hypothetical protein
MTMGTTATALATLLALASAGLAQQKGQYILGTNGLNAGIQPAPGFAYSNLSTFNGSDRLKGPDGEPVPVEGNFALKVNQNFFIYTSPWKLFGGTFGATGDLVIANGSITAPQIGVSGGGVGISDTYIQPFTLGYHFPRVDFSIGFGFIAPTGRFQANSTDNTGSGYWGYIPSLAATIYFTKDKRTILSVFSAYEFHGRKRDTNITPGQTYDLEWALGQAIPVKSHVLQLGVGGYGQWQTSRNGGTQPSVIQDARYRVVAIGPEATFIVPKWNANFFFRYEPEFAARARVEGSTIAFGGAISFPVTK